jgi:2-polyprenyl-3-methyl-5-hydroxy-6-metoxy-1,4-benzoquinol methylase
MSAERAERIEALGYDYAALAKEPVRGCNLCGSTHLVEAARSDRYGFPAVLRVCAACGLGFLSPRPTADEYARFYESVYRPLVSAFHGHTIDATTVQAEQREYAAGVLDFLRSTLPAAPASVMDVGGSTGVVAGAVRAAFGAEATVLDPAPDELEVAAAAGMETIGGFVEDYEPAGRTWDLVLLCQTADHLLDVRATLAAMRGMLAEGGHAYVDVVDLLWAMRRGGQVEAAVKVDHPHYLSRETALGYFAATGFEVVAERLSGEGEWGFLLRAGERREPDRERLGAFADRLLEEIWTRRATSA